VASLVPFVPEMGVAGGGVDAERSQAVSTSINATNRINPIRFNIIIFSSWNCSKVILLTLCLDTSTFFLKRQAFNRKTGSVILITTHLGWNCPLYRLQSGIQLWPLIKGG
jgi:hypothetical protein